MAYFANGSAGECFHEQCAICKYGEAPCPIAFVQFNYNYRACNNKIARGILDNLISDNGDCSMYKMFEKDFKI